jgi:HEAT repeat protein
LLRLAEDAEPAVVAGALRPLIDIDPDLLVSRADGLVRHGDANIRSLAVEVLLRRPTEKHLRLLGDGLDDVDPDVRRACRGFLRELATKSAWRSHVVAEASRLLARTQWRGLEQAAILLVQLEHKPAAKRLVELLPFERPEVAITAAWGLRKLAVADTLPDVTAYVDEQLKSALESETPKARPGLDHQLSQLNQFLGQQKYAAADGILKRFIPKRPMFEARAAAIWALGLLHEGKPLPELVTVLEARLNDSAMPPEDSRVRLTSALTLGRLNAKQALPSLRNGFSERAPSLNPVNNACGWAIAQITGHAMPPPRTIQQANRDWFLIPNQ